MSPSQRILIAALLMAGASTNLRGQDPKTDVADKGSSQASSLGQALDNPEHHPVHILYIHGIGAESAGASLPFQKLLCRSLKGCAFAKIPAPVREEAQEGDFAKSEPPALRYMGSPVWSNAQDWKAARPFVDHYSLPSTGGAPVFVHEINWWPLVLSLKCRYIMVGEANLAGPDRELLDLCSGKGKKDTQHPDEQPYSWITPEQAKNAESNRARAARFNRGVKNSLMDWGFSDPMLAVGPMGQLFQEAMRQLFVESAVFKANNTASDDFEMNPAGGDFNREFIVVSHSLGSFLVFSTLTDRVSTQQCAEMQSGSNETGTAATGNSDAKEARAACYILAHTSIIYFFANQVPLLQLASLTEDVNIQNIKTQLKKWQELRRAQTYITAFSDPSDLLSWHFPKISETVVDNCYVRNTFWHWLIAPPEGAHVNYARNPRVLRIMMNPQKDHGSCTLAQ
jgi:hypothetical protein